MNNYEKILIVDDDRILLTYIKHQLGSKFNIFTAETGIQGLEHFEYNGPFAVVAADYMMSDMNGVEFLNNIQVNYPETVRMMLTGITDLNSLMDIINNINVFRFIRKPCSSDIFSGILEKGIEQYLLVQSEKKKKEEVEAAYKQMIQYAKALNETVASLKNKNMELNDAYYDTIHRLVIASEYKDEDTHEHIMRMSRYSALLAKILNFTPDDVENILFASPMHDVGKIGIPDAILMKPGKLTEDEFNQIKTHTTIGAKILEESNADILKLAGVIALTHHERWDGKGYPYGLSDNAIPLVGRIASIADTFDALTSQRPYKDPYPVDVAFNIIKNEKGGQFEPLLVDIFCDNFKEFIKIKEEIRGAEEVSFLNFVLSDRDNL